jgi:hypothetical protein
LFHTQDKKQAINETSTEACIQGVKSKDKDHLLLGLLDTCATGIFVRKTAFQNIVHQIKNISIQVKGQNALLKGGFLNRIDTSMQHRCL